MVNNYLSTNGGQRIHLPKQFHMDVPLWVFRVSRWVHTSRDYLVSNCERKKTKIEKRKQQHRSVHSISDPNSNISLFSLKWLTRYFVMNTTCIILIYNSKCNWLVEGLTLFTSDREGFVRGWQERGMVVDNSNHIQTSASAKGDIIWGISVHSIHKEGVLFFSSVYIKKDELKVDVQNETLSLDKKWTIDMLVSYNLNFHSLLSYDNSPKWLPNPCLLGFTRLVTSFEWKGLQ